mmetsp:Transcript_6297/g.13581  ORF Transcript_6297/g.13581 Transcript_6297/m.13581 type:complete len:233 (-) Transcript_6297:205-903(-)|eukprot:CAMPEP_0206576276 /NCGR_PEP_ID=MMETSP0325_2-20121206/30639_1 /ASSEMBLY_ACC=CAM_ASM_000347 /TAXON_ID=2866 /ORGANISM="Crypthecodinium cohnii, Strain Seligo" /LENGTH=232 /DNA_ID=CAMNT_0054081429 /DNA_START=71 /DNA_END=769 /DNA_ORIENTATION=-
MYALRGINNRYEGGTRSDFVVVGHPEYQLGKVRACSYGFPAGWDVSNVPMLPKRSAVADSFRRRGGSTRSLVKKLTSTTPRGSPRSRALAAAASQAVGRTGTDQQAASGVVESGLRSTSRNRPAKTAKEEFEEFLKVLSSPESLPLCLPSARLTGGSCNHLSSAGAVRHYERMNEEILTWAKRYQRDPVATRQELNLSQAWRYYADHLRRAAQQGAVLKSKGSASAPSFAHH